MSTPRTVLWRLHKRSGSPAILVCSLRSIILSFLELYHLKAIILTIRIHAEIWRHWRRMSEAQILEAANEISPRFFKTNRCGARWFNACATHRNPGDRSRAPAARADFAAVVWSEGNAALDDGRTRKRR